MGRGSSAVHDYSWTVAAVLIVILLALTLGAGTFPR
jgi:hypothetical protein